MNSFDRLQALETALFQTFGDRVLTIEDLPERLLTFASRSKVRRCVYGLSSKEEVVLVLSRLLKENSQLFQ